VHHSCAKRHVSRFAMHQHLKLAHGRAPQVRRAAGCVACAQFTGATSRVHR
jgi:hypothetical protein